MVSSGSGSALSDRWQARSLSDWGGHGVVLIGTAYSSGGRMLAGRVAWCCDPVRSAENVREFVGLGGFGVANAALLIHLIKSPISPFGNFLQV